MDIKRNELAELIAEDGQPSRVIINYLQEAMELLNNFDCVTDYYTKEKGRKLVSNSSKLKLTKELFLDALSTAHSQLRQINEKPLKLTDLYMNQSFENNSDDEDFDEEHDIPCHGYYLTDSKKKDSCSDFLIVFNDKLSSPIIASIEVCYFEEEYYKHHEIIKFKRTNQFNEHIELFINESDGNYTIDYKEDEIKYIIPMNKVSF